jgi:hypothetical protein
MRKGPRHLQRKLIRITSDISAEILKVRKVWDDLFKALRANNCQPRLHHPTKLFFKSMKK